MKKTWYASLKEFSVETWNHFFSVRPTRMASSLSYYALFSLIPILVIAFWIGSTLIDTQTLAGEIIERASYVLGPQSSSFLQTTFTNAASLSGHQFQTIVAIIILVALAVSGISELKKSLDDIWETPYVEAKNFWAWMLSYLVPLLATVAFGIAFILFILAAKFFQVGFTFGLSESTRDFISSIGGPFVMFLITTGGTFLAYMLLPERYVPRGRLLLGSVITGIFLTLGNTALSFYLTHGTTLSTYGVAGSIVAVLLWFYYSSLMFLFGASTTWVYHRMKEGLTDER